ncbi:MAG: HAMP domain-containing histidine kinase [Candidatus Margulisbacteria bacterium]|nr:HAMP domain-containing histidine kinase [Candidatus Margulisiibacteriota bacterium]
MTADQQNKILALRNSIWATYAVVPVAFGIIFCLTFLGFNIPVISLVITASTAVLLATMMLFFIKVGWLIDIMHDYLYAVLIWCIVAVGLYLTGTILSPFLWVCLFDACFEILNYNYKKGLIEAGAYLAFIWANTLLSYFGVIDTINFIPAISLDNYPRLIFTLLLGITMLFISIPVVIAATARNLQEEKRRAQALAKEKDWSSRVTMSMMEDLALAKKELEDRLGEIKQSREATMHLLKDVEKQKEDLKQIDRMKSEFLSVMSHELRTPLTPILEFTSLFRDGVLGQVNDNQKKALDSIYKQSMHLRELIENVIDASRTDLGKGITLKKEPVSPRVLLEDILSVLDFDLRDAQVSVETDFCQDVPTISADENSLKRVLVNLIGNAIKFGPKGSRIRISIVEENSSVKFCVADQGIGITGENISKVFDKFYQVDSSLTRTHGGIGMGLPIAKRLIEAHGGKIWVESEGVGKGTSIYFTVPLS